MRRRTLLLLAAAGLLAGQTRQIVVISHRGEHLHHPENTMPAYQAAAACVAGPGLVDRPVVASFDEQGRLYVADSSGSSDKLEKQLAEKPHRIVRLEDTDGDGVFDRSTTFADDLTFPTGVLWHDGAVYATAHPNHCIR